MPTSDITTNYGPSGVSTTTQPVGVNNTGGNDLGYLLQQVLRKRLLAAGNAAPRQTAAAAPPPAAAPVYQQEERPRKSQLDLARERDELLQIQARQQPAPMRMVTGAGITPGYTMDTNAMNAYQRAAYLPSNSSGSYSPGSQLSARNDAANEGAFDENMLADRARTKGMYGSELGYAQGYAPKRVEDARAATDHGFIPGRQQAVLSLLGR